MKQSERLGPQERKPKRKFSIRSIEARGGYVDKIKWMDRICFPTDSPVSFDGAYWWFAFDEDQIPVGYAALSFFPQTGNAFLSRVGVLPTGRGHGLHKRFIRARERFAVGEGYARIVTYTAANNVFSGNNLIACGYRLYIPPFEWGCIGGNYWEKIIKI